jgi:hypothetical protein
MPRLGAPPRIRTYALAVDALPLATTLTISWSQLSSVVRSGKPLATRAFAVERVTRIELA